MLGINSINFSPLPITTLPFFSYPVLASRSPNKMISVLFLLHLLCPKYPLSASFVASFGANTSTPLTSQLLIFVWTSVSLSFIRLYPFAAPMRLPNYNRNTTLRWHLLAVTTVYMNVICCFFTNCSISFCFSEIGSICLLSYLFLPRFILFSC